MDEEILESFLTFIQRCNSEVLLNFVMKESQIVMIIILFKMYLSILEKKHSLLLMN